MDDSIKSAEDLAMQTKIKYGAVTGGSTSSFFKVLHYLLSQYIILWSDVKLKIQIFLSISCQIFKYSSISNW